MVGILVLSMGFRMQGRYGEDFFEELSVRHPLVITVEENFDVAPVQRKIPFFVFVYAVPSGYHKFKKNGSSYHRPIVTIHCFHLLQENRFMEESRADFENF